MLTSSDLEQLERARRGLTGLRLQTAMLRWQLALKAGFNPGQPRVPRGNRDGGQWARVAGGVGEGTTFLRDDSDEQAWENVVNTYREDGSLAGQVITNRDGSTIRSEFSAQPARTGWTERHTVVGADGTIRVFENAGFAQTVLDGDGTILSAGAWPVPPPDHMSFPQPAFLPFAVAGGAATVELGLVLLTWLLSSKRPGQEAVAAFTARDFLSAASSPVPRLDFVGLLTREQVREACPRLGEVQRRTDDAAEAVRLRGETMSASQFGTAVHMNLKRQIDPLNDPDFRAEVSFLKELEEAYGEPGSIRVDVFENVDGMEICVYDIKTGVRGLSAQRAAEIVKKVFTKFPFSKRIIVVEVRPTT